MKKEVRHYLFALIMDSINEGMKHQDTETNITNYQNLLAHKIMRKHGIDMIPDWMFEDQEYLNDWDNDLYSMPQIAHELIHKANKYIDEAPEYISKDQLKLLMTSYEFDVNMALQERNVKESD